MKLRKRTAALVRRTAATVLALWLLAPAGCRSDGDGVFEADVSRGERAALEEIAAGWRIIPLATSDTVCPIGEVQTMKCCDGLVLLQEQRTRRILAFEEGRFTGELARAGRGPEEYGEIGTFTYDAVHDRILLFDRNTRTLKGYARTTGRLEQSLTLDFYVAALEHVAGSRFLALRETGAPGSDDAVALLLDLHDGSVAARLPLTPVQSDLLTDMAITREGEGSLLLALPGAENRIYRVDSTGFTLLARVGFGRAGAERRFWEGQCDNPFYLAEWLESGAPAAIAPSYCQLRDGRMLLWYVSRYGSAREARPGLSLLLADTTAQRAVAELVIEGVAGTIQPLCAAEGHYFTLIHPGDITDAGRSPLAGELAAAAARNSDADNPLLVVFKL